MSGYFRVNLNHERWQTDLRIVQSVSRPDATVDTNGPLLHKTLAVSGVAFDELRLVASGPNDDGVAFIGIDNVRAVPEPASMLGTLALSVGTWLLLKRKQKMS